MRPGQVNLRRRPASQFGVGHQRQVRILGPQAERAVRPDRVDYPHEVLPITPALTLTRGWDNVVRTAGTTWALLARAPRSGRAWIPCPLRTPGAPRAWVRSCGTACSWT